TFSAYSFFLFFYFFSFFRPRGGGRVGHVEGQDLKGMLSYAGSFAVLQHLPAIRITFSAYSFFLFFYFFSFFRPRGGGRVGHVEGQDL
ncbi:hypothetical protein CKJ90_30640, partial [Klebsiella pneumoniae]